MKMVSNEASGYDLHWVEDPPDELKCQICLCVAKDPQQHPGDFVNQCGKLFCQDCISIYQRRKATCPNCRQNLILFLDAKSARQIRSLQVKCGNLTNGCKWIGELGSLETHLQSCDYALLPCTNQCKADNKILTLLRQDFSRHIDNECPRRQYKCPHCKEVGEHQERTTTHLGICIGLRIKCPNTGCQEMIAHDDVETHQSTCDYESVSCNYASIGCKKKMLRKYLTEHGENDQLHLQIIRERVLELSQRVTILETNPIRTATNDIQNSHTEWVSSLATVTRTFEIREYEALKINDKDFYTSSFYTSFSGYKMCLRVFPSGCGSGAGTHVSVFLYLMKGDHDDTLTWPFTGSVTFKLLNQLEDDNHHKSYSVKFLADAKASQRVVYDKTSVEGWGIHKFIPHTFVENDNANIKYLKDNTLILKVTVHVPQLFVHIPMQK